MIKCPYQTTVTVYNKKDNKDNKNPELKITAIYTKNFTDCLGLNCFFYDNINTQCLKVNKELRER